MPVSKSGSAAHIIVRPRSTTPSDPLASLRRLLDDCGSNQNDRVIAFITAAIGDGVNTRAEIIDLGMRLGLDPKHVVINLNKGAGNSPHRHSWRRDEQGTYSLLD
jgi:uncharacterized protein (DUF849 family)